jgi:hypothetical protein
LGIPLSPTVCLCKPGANGSELTFLRPSSLNTKTACHWNHTLWWWRSGLRQQSSQHVQVTQDKADHYDESNEIDNAVHVFLHHRAIIAKAALAIGFEGLARVRKMTAQDCRPPVYLDQVAQ